MKKVLPSTGKNKIWQVAKDNDLKNNPDYAAYNFRNKKQEDEFKVSGYLPTATPSIYNQRAVEFIISVLKAE